MTKAIFFRVLCRKKYKFPKAERTMSYPHTHATRGKLQNFYLHNIFLVLQILLFHSLRFFFFFSFPILRWNFMHLVFDLRRIDGFLLGLFCYHKPNIFSFFFAVFLWLKRIVEKNKAMKKKKSSKRLKSPMSIACCTKRLNWSHFGFTWKIYIAFWISIYLFLQKCCFAQE